MSSRMKTAGTGRSCPDRPRLGRSSAVTGCAPAQPFASNRHARRLSRRHSANRRVVLEENDANTEGLS